MTNLALLNLLINAKGSVIIGSKGLGLENCNDIDIAMLDSDYRLLKVSENNYFEGEMKNYFSVLPMGNNKLVKFDGVDLLLFEHQRNLDAVSEVIELMKQIPKSILQVKRIRVYIFEQLLITDHGFKNRDNGWLT